MGKKILIVRHAHRDKPFGQAFDNGLSEKGRAQASTLVSEWGGELKKTETQLLSSPKKRCLETLRPLSEFLKLKIEIDSRLDEESPESDAGEFMKNIRSFAKEWLKTQVEFTVVCSHGDWIPEFFRIMTGKARDLKKGEAVLLKRKEVGFDGG